MKRGKLLFVGLGVTVVYSMALALADEWQTAGALWLTVLCLSPALWVALGTQYKTVQIFCATTLITQAVSVPIFYLRPENYSFGFHRPFSFAAVDVLPIFSLVGVFLWTVACVAKTADWALPSETRSRCPSITPMRLNKPWAAPAILFLIIFSLPMRFWMFRMGIGLVGAAPPKLPFRISGMLFYLMNYVTPLLIGYCYTKTRRNSFLLAFVVSSYGFLIGTAAVSKGVVLLTSAAVIGFALLDGRWLILSLSGLMSGFGVTIASHSREIVHVADGGGLTSSNTSLGLLGTIAETFSRLDWSLESLSVYVEITNRVEGFLGLLLSSRFNAEAVGGSLAILAKAINNRWANLGHDALHMEYLGYAIPEGFYNAAASLNAWYLMASNGDMMMIPIFALYVAFVLVVLNRAATGIAIKYSLPSHMSLSIIFVATMLFYTGPGTVEFLTVFVCACLGASLPPLGFLSRTKSLGTTLLLKNGQPELSMN